MKDKVIVGYDLCNQYSQISYCTLENGEPETVSLVAGAENYNIPTALCKREGVSQWFYGRDAYRHAQAGDGVLVTDLVDMARAGDPVLVEEEEYDPVALLTLFVRRSLALLNMALDREHIDAMMITCEKLDARMIEILGNVAAGLGLKTKDVFFQGHVESFYYYMIHQPQELWRRQVMVCDYNESPIRVYRLECNRRTTPVVAFVEEEEYPFMPCGTLPEEGPGRNAAAADMDERLLSGLKLMCEGRMITSVYLIGQGFYGDWMDESLKYLCRNRRVFQGSNLYSKGACFGMREKISSSEVGRSHVFLGNEKLKANIGMKVLRHGADSYLALLDAGVSWFDACREVEFFLDGGNTFSLIITPLNGRDVRYAEVTLDGLPEREGAASRLFMAIRMTSESRVELEIEDRGFGEIYPSSSQRWKESFEVA